MKHIEVSQANWQRIVKLRKEYSLKNNNCVIDELFLLLDEQLAKEKKI
jgi:hypothetical protein